MKKILIIALGPIILGPAGYFLGKMLAPEPAVVQDEPVAVVATPDEILYKMPLGKFTIQVLQPKKILHILIDMDVYIAGVTDFERLNGAQGRNRLRDATISIISDMAETTLWLAEGEEDNIDHTKMAEDIVRKLHRTFPSLRTGRINEFTTTRTSRK